jgi:hypothetical protein
VSAAALAISLLHAKRTPFGFWFLDWSLGLAATAELRYAYVALGLLCHGIWKRVCQSICCDPAVLEDPATHANSTHVHVCREEGDMYQGLNTIMTLDGFQFEVTLLHVEHTLLARFRSSALLMAQWHSTARATLNSARSTDLVPCNLFRFADPVSHARVVQSEQDDARHLRGLPRW